MAEKRENEAERLRTSCDEAQPVGPGHTGHSEEPLTVRPYRPTYHELQPIQINEFEAPASRPFDLERLVATHRFVLAERALKIGAAVEAALFVLVLKGDITGEQFLKYSAWFVGATCVAVFSWYFAKEWLPRKRRAALVAPHKQTKHGKDEAGKGEW